MSTLAGQAEATVAAQDGFEGAEKVLEIDFVEKEVQESASVVDVPAHDHRAKGVDSGMRAVSRREWDSILDLAQCQILTHESNSFLDSYVLSESSLFVYSHKIVLKTCGTTTLLRCVPALLAAAAKLGLAVEWISFTRKDFLFPKCQAFPHTSFDEEVKFLLGYFPEGSAYVLGPITGDHWYVFIADYVTFDYKAEDCTLDIMMYEMDPSVAKLFGFDVNADSVSSSSSDSASLASSDVATDSQQKKEEEKGATSSSPPATPTPEEQREQSRALSRESGIADLLPGATIQDWKFLPCGYSMNGLMENHEKAYFTIHVTPEIGFSYASFETNLRLRSYKLLVERVLAVFRPRRFTMTIFADDNGTRAIEEDPFKSDYTLPRAAGEGGRKAAMMMAATTGTAKENKGSDASAGVSDAKGMGKRPERGAGGRYICTGSSSCNFAGDYNCKMGNYTLVDK